MPTSGDEPRTLIRAFAEALPLAVADADPEGVHRVRSSALRLSVALELRGIKALRPDLAWLRHELRRARDLDVALERELPPALRTRWLVERAGERSRVCAAIRSARVLGVAVAAEAALCRIAPDPTRLVRRLERVRARAKSALRTPEDLEPIHSLRKQLRRARIGLAEFGLRLGGVSSLVSELGAVSDAHAFGELIATLPESALSGDERARLADVAAREERLRARHALSLVDSRLDGILRRARKLLRKLE